MEATNNFPAPLIKPALIGALIGLVVILSFVLRVDEPAPEWPRYWMLKPLVITPLAGALGGICYYFLGQFYYRNIWLRIVLKVFSVAVFVIGLWLGIVLGLDGTLWD